MTHHAIIQDYLHAMHNQALVQVDLLQDGLVTLSLPAAPCCNFATLRNAIAWLLPYVDRPHGVCAQQLTQQGETLVAWFERADTGFVPNPSRRPPARRDGLAMPQPTRRALPARQFGDLA